MNTDLFSTIDALGSICEYRAPDKLAEVLGRIQTEVGSLQGECSEQATERDRFLYALDILDKMVLTVRVRASKCELQHAELACENVDLFQILVDWIDFMKKEL